MYACIDSAETSVKSIGVHDVVFFFFFFLYRHVLPKKSKKTCFTVVLLFRSTEVVLVRPDGTRKDSETFDTMWPWQKKLRDVGGEKGKTGREKWSICSFLAFFFFFWWGLIEQIQLSKFFRLFFLTVWCLRFSVAWF